MPELLSLEANLGQEGAHGADYAASKAALEIWSKSLAMRVGQTGQRVNIVAPGFVDTDILAGDSAEKRKPRIDGPSARVGTPLQISLTQYHFWQMKTHPMLQEQSFM